MSALTRLLSFTPFLRWSLGLKLTAAFLVATLLPVVTATLLIGREVTASDRATITRYLEQENADRQALVNDALNDARQSLNLFVDNPTYRGQIFGLLAVSDSENVLAPQDLQAYVDENLIGSGQFTRVMILGDSGRVLLASREVAGEPPMPVGTDLSASPVYLEGQAAYALGESRRTVLTTEGEQQVLDFVRVFEGSDSIIGYVIGTINTRTIITSTFIERGSLLPVTSLLATTDGRTLSSGETRLLTNLPQVDRVIQAAINGETGSRLTRFEDGTASVVAYARIVDTPFAILSETDANESLTITLEAVAANLGFYALLFALEAVLFAVLVTLTIAPPLRRLALSVNTYGSGGDDIPPALLARADEIGMLSRTIQLAGERNNAVVADLKRSLDERLRDLAATQEVSRFAAQQRDLQTLMDTVVRLITDLFPNIYHAQIFLVDEAHQFALLRASTGEIGRRLLERGHRLEVGSVSVIGQVTDEGRVVVARDIASSNIHRQNEFLPETRAELAIPLRTSADIIGALDVQSKESDSFTDDQIKLLQIMADQIAVAIDNTRLYQESIQRLQEITASNQQATQLAWQDYMSAQRVRVLSSEAGFNAISPADDLRQRAIATGEPAIGQRTAYDTIPIAVPIVLREQVLGAVEWELRAVDYHYEKVLLGQELVNRLAISLDNARLFQESRQAINRERLVNEISARLTSQTDITGILETAVQEVSQALRVPQVRIQLKQAAPENGSGHLPDDE